MGSWLHIEHHTQKSVILQKKKSEELKSFFSCQIIVIVLKIKGMVQFIQKIQSLFFVHSDDTVSRNGFGWCMS